MLTMQMLTEFVSIYLSSFGVLERLLLKVVVQLGTELALQAVAEVAEQALQAVPVSVQ